MNKNREFMFKEYLYKRANQDKLVAEYQKLYEAAAPVIGWLSSKDNESFADTEEVNNLITVYKSLDLNPIVPE
jgi:hypothetical protein